jgi:serine/threonine protein kinase
MPRNGEKEGVKGQDFLPLEPGTKICGGYRVKKVLGQGVYGRVSMVTTKGGKEYAAKQMINNEHPVSDSIIKEVDFLHRLDHPNVMRSRSTDFLLGKKAGHIPQVVCVVGEVMEGDLSELEADEATKRDMWVQVLQGVEYLHANFVIHQDIKPENILFGRDTNGDPIVKIADYGVCVATGSSRKVPYNRTVITAPYRPPELLVWDADQDKILKTPVAEREEFYYGDEVDIFSLGVMGMTFLLGIPLAYAEDVDAHLDLLFKRGVFLPRGFEIDEGDTDYGKETLEFYERVTKALEKLHYQCPEVLELKKVELKLLRKMINVPDKRPKIREALESFRKAYGFKSRDPPKVKTSFSKPNDLRLKERKRVIGMNIPYIQMAVDEINLKNNDSNEYFRSLVLQSLDIFDRCAGIFLQTDGKKKRGVPPPWLASSREEGLEVIRKISLFICLSMMVPNGVSYWEIDKEYSKQTMKEKDKVIAKFLEGLKGEYYRPTLDQTGEMTKSELLSFLRTHQSPNSIEFSSVSS